MDQGIISMRYAKALLRYAEENGEAERVYQETIKLGQTFQSLPALYKALLNPVLQEEKKRDLLLKAVAGENHTTRSWSDFVALLIKKQRTELVVRIAFSYGTLYREKNHIVRGRLVLPAEVDEKSLIRLREMVEAKASGKVDFEKVVDPSILGGFVLEYDTYRLDASVRGQLSRIREELA